MLTSVVTKSSIPPLPPSLIPVSVQNNKPAPFFDPRSIGSCRLWLDAADPSVFSLSGTTVNQWIDKSGNRNNATGVGSVTYASSNVSLTGGHFTLNLNFLVSVSHYAYIVLNNTNFVNIYGAITGGFGSNSLHIGFENSSRYRMNFWGNDFGPLITANYRVNQVNLLNFEWVNNASKRVFANGVLEGEVNQQGIIGAMSGGGTIGNVVSQGILTGGIREILIYTGVQTTTQRQQVEGYLAWKWGLQANLPSTHPFLRGPPSPFPQIRFPTAIRQEKSYFIDFPSYFTFGISSSNFSSALPLTLAGNSIYTGNILRFTTTLQGQRGSMFFQRRTQIVNFTTEFNLRFDSTLADGATFCIQNASSNALGTDGGFLGYGGISNSVAIRFDTYDTTSGQFSTDILTGGTVPSDMGGSGNLNSTFGLAPGGTWNFLISVSYNGTTLSYTIRNFNNRSQFFTSNAPINIPAIIGSPNAFIGFTASTGGFAQTCSLISWNWSNSKA